MAQDYYTREEAAQVLGVAPEAIDQMLASGQITGQEEGGVLRFNATEIAALAQNQPSAFDAGASGEFGSSEYSSSEFTGSEFSQPQVMPEGSEFGSDPEILPQTKSSSEFDISAEIGAIESSSEFDLPAGGTGLQAPAPTGGTGVVAPSGPDMGSDIDINVEGVPALAPPPPPATAKKSSVLKMAPADDSLDFGAGPAASQLGAEAPLAPSQMNLLPTEDSLDFDAPPAPAPSQVQLAGPPAPTTGGSFKGPRSGAPAIQPPGESDVRLDMESGAFEFKLSAESSNRLGPESGPKSVPPAPSSGRLKPKEDDSDVRLDFDPGAASADDDLIGVGDKPDSDVRIDPVSQAGGSKAGLLPPGQDLMETEQIDLDEELQKAAEASLVKKRTSPQPGKTKVTQPQAPGQGAPAAKTHLPAPPVPTMLPQSSPFELSTEDLEIGSLGQSGLGQTGTGAIPTGKTDVKKSGLGMAAPPGGGSEFELTLAPEDEAPRTHPLKLGDDEDIDLGAMPPPSKGDSSSRAELSGINLQKPADSGRSLERKKTGTGDSSTDSVDFELTLDEESPTGPKTLRGKMTDSDSEFELTLDEASSKSLPRPSKVSGLDSSGEQKDIFETDFDLQAAGVHEESGSQAVALDEPDTDLESSDFDLALEEESASQVVPLEEDTSSLDTGAPPKKSKVSRVSKVSKVDQSLEGADSLLDEELLASEEEGTAAAVEEEDEEAVPTVPSAQAEWGVVPLLMLFPCVLIMFMAGLMAYELVHNMWGYHQATKPSGLLVEGFAKMFEPSPK